MQQSDNLTIVIKETGETLTVLNWFKGSPYQVALLRFADGSELSAEQVTSLAVSFGTDYNDYIFGNDTMTR